MNNESFYDSIVKEALDAIINISLMDKISDFNLEQIKLFTNQFYFLVKNFPKYLGALIWKCDDESIRLSIVANLVDECGGIKNVENGVLSEVHPEIYRRFARSLGISDSALNNGCARIYTQNMLLELEELFINSPFLEAFGGMALGIESISSIWLERLYIGLKSKGIFSNDDLLYFSLHVKVDQEHGELFKRSILPCLNDKVSREQLRTGTMKMIDSQRKMFLGIEEDIINSCGLNNKALLF